MSVRKVLCCCICNTCPNGDDSSSTTSNNIRDKHSLNSGNGLIDWIRLGNSGLDLTGVGGQVRLISPAELKKHNKRSDAWLAIRGRVYNITYYLRYHPGGAEELMRGAGQDATEIFEKVHPWINYESLLVKCLVGTLRIDTQDNEIFYDTNDSFPESDLLIKSPFNQENITNKNHLEKYSSKSKMKSPHLLPDDSQKINIELDNLAFSKNLGTLKVLKREKYPHDVPPAIFFDWEQSLTKLIISVFTGPFSNPGACIRITERIMIIEVTINNWVRTVRFLPEESIEEPLYISVCHESGKIEIVAQKDESKMWKCCGEVTIGTATKLASYKIAAYKVLCNEPVTHDTRLLTMAPVSGYKVFPIGHHIQIHETIGGLEYIRSYTPVDALWNRWKRNSSTAQLQIAIKRYDNGIVSPMLTSLQSGDTVKVSGPCGTFLLDKIKFTKTIYLLAAGTGITPMLGLIKFMLSYLSRPCERVTLLFFNKTQKDIMFQEHLEALTRKDQRFNVVHILSSADSSWTGYRGRVNLKLISEILSEIKISDEAYRFACICGPTGFSYTSLNALKNLGMEESFIHVF